MTRAELADAMGIEPVTYDFDIEELRKQQQSGERKSPPRRNIKVYPYLPGTLSYMSKAKYKKEWTETWEKFVQFYKPWIELIDGKWEITEYGLKALEQLDDKTEVINE
jgi:hypothetical protein